MNIGFQRMLKHIKERVETPEELEDLLRRFRDYAPEKYPMAVLAAAEMLSEWQRTGSAGLAP